jgi:amidase
MEANMKGELANLDATEQAELVRRKEVSPLELVDAAITYIEKVNPQLNAVITPLFDKARAQAQEPRGSSLPDGPFRGSPVPAEGPDLRHRRRSNLRRYAIVA